jgi:hypothetical protein
MNPGPMLPNQMMQVPQMNHSLMFPGMIASTPRMNAPINRQPDQSIFSPHPAFNSPPRMSYNQNQNIQYFQNPAFIQNPGMQTPLAVHNPQYSSALSTPMMMTPTLHPMTPNNHPNLSFSSFNFQSPLPMHPYATQPYATVPSTPSFTTTPGINVLQTPIYTQFQPNTHFVFPNQSMISTLESNDTPGFVKSMLNENRSPENVQHTEVHVERFELDKHKLVKDQIEKQAENLDQVLKKQTDPDQTNPEKFDQDQIDNLEIGVQKINLESPNQKQISKSPGSEWAELSHASDHLTSSGFHSTRSTSRHLSENRSISNTQLSNSDENLEMNDQKQGIENQDFEQQGFDQQGSDKPWMNNRIKKAIGKRQEAYTKQKEAQRVIEQYIEVHGERCEFREAALEETKRVYKKKRNLVVTLTRVAKKQYEDKTFRVPPRFQETPRFKKERPIQFIFSDKK